MNRARTLLTLALAALLGTLAIAQGPRPARVTLAFDDDLAAATPHGAVPPVGDAPLRLVDQRGGRGAVLTGAGLVYALADSGAQQGAETGRAGSVSLGVQPLVAYDDAANHLLLRLGAPEAAGTLQLWKTQVANDLRWRAYLAEGRFVEILHPGAATWRPGTWHHVVASWGNGELRLIVDGSHAGRVDLPIDFRAAATPLTLGGEAGGDAPAMAVLDDVQIHDAARNPQGAQRDYEAFLSAERPSVDLPYHRPPRGLGLDFLPPAETTYAVVSDLHIPAEGAHGRYQHGERVEELVEQLNAAAPEFVLDAGDINTSFPTRPDFEACNANAKRILSKLKPPIYHAPGNHDVGNKHQFDNVPFPGWLVSLENIEYYREWFGRDYFSIDHEGLHLVLVNNQVFNSLPEYDAAQWQWLLDDLKANAGRPSLVVMHNPLFWVDPGDRGTNNYEVVNEPRRSQFIELCGEHDIPAVYTGHTHHAISNLIDDTWLLTLPSTTFARNFGDNYGLPGAEVVYDPARVGYLLARVVDGRIHHHTVRTYAPLAPPRALVAGEDAPETRMLPRASGETVDPRIALLAPPVPDIQRNIWHADFAIDGVAQHPNLELHAWTSDAYPGDAPAAELLEVRLPAPVAAQRLELWARPGGSGFPLAATVAVRERDGAEWQQVGAWDAPPDVRTAPWAVELGGRPVAGIRIDITAMPPMHQGRRASIAEVVLLDADGRDAATRQRGATVTAGSMVGGDKRTVNDNLWQAARDVGARDMVLAPTAVGDGAGFAWADTAGFVGDPLARATTLGRVPDVRLWLPLTLDPPAGTDADAGFEPYVRSLLDGTGPGVGGLLIWAMPEHAPDLVARRLRQALAAAGDVPVGLRLASLEQLDALATGLAGAARVQVPDLGDAALARVRDPAGTMPVWVELLSAPAADGTPPRGGADRATAWLGRASRLLDAGFRLVAPPAGSRDGVLNEVGLPTPMGHVVGTLNTLLDEGAATEVKLLCDAGANGSAVSVTAPRQAYVIDPLRGTMAAVASTVTLSGEAAPVVVVGR